MVHDSRGGGEGDTQVREQSERRKEGRAGGGLQGGAEERASWQRVRAQTEFLMGDDPLFTDLSEAIVYDRGYSLAR